MLCELPLETRNEIFDDPQPSSPPDLQGSGPIVRYMTLDKATDMSNLHPDFSAGFVKGVARRC